MTQTTKYLGVDFPPKCPWWKLLLARLCGKTAGGCDGTTMVRGHYWRGKLYITSINQNPKHVPAEEFDKWLKTIKQ